MNPKLSISARLLAVLTCVAAFGPIGLVSAAALLINPFVPGALGTSYPIVGGSTKAQIITDSPDGSEISFDLDVIKGSTQSNIMYDNMIGQLGTGKAFIDYSSSLPKAGTTVNINTIVPLGGSGVAAGGTRVGNEEQLRPGNFPLSIGQWWWGVGITNTGRSETIIGRKWDEISQPMLSPLIGKKCTNDMINALRKAATSDNIIYPNGKTLDTLSSGDTYSAALLIDTGNVMSRIGAKPMTVETLKKGGVSVDIKKYPNLVTKQGSNPIKADPAYRNAMLYAQDRGDANPFFTGEIKDIDGQLVIPWENEIDGAFGPVGSPLQPEAFLGTAIVAKATTNHFPGGLSSSDAGGLDGGGSAEAAALARNYFEHFSLFNYLNMSQSTIVFGTGTRYFAVINATDKKVSFFSYTGNAGGYNVVNQLTGLTRLGSTIAGDYNTTVGDVTWNSGAFLTAADGNGYMGVSEGLIAAGSLIVETNSKGVPICEGLGLGAMAGVCGWGTTAISNKKMGGRTTYTAPHNQAFAEGFEIAWGCAAYKRADTKLPNFVRQIFARQVPNMPYVA